MKVHAKEDHSQTSMLVETKNLLGYFNDNETILKSVRLITARALASLLRAGWDRWWPSSMSLTFSRFGQSTSFCKTDLHINKVFSIKLVKPSCFIIFIIWRVPCFVSSVLLRLQVKLTIVDMSSAIFLQHYISKGLSCIRFSCKISTFTHLSTYQAVVREDLGCIDTRQHQVKAFAWTSWYSI